MFSFYLGLSNESFFRIDGYHLLLALPGVVLLDSCQVVDLSFHRRYLIGQKSSLSIQPFFLGLHLPLNNLFDGNVFFPEVVHGLEAPDVVLIAGHFDRLLQLLTLSVDLLVEISGLGVELLLHGFNESNSLGFKHLFHLRTDLARQGFNLVGQS